MKKLTTLRKNNRYHEHNSEKLKLYNKYGGKLSLPSTNDRIGVNYNKNF